jgi:alpha-tubulin suppressor-like RCC1 family protein
MCTAGRPRRIAFRALGPVLTIVAACGDATAPDAPITSHWRQLATGGGHTCALAAGGDAFCWGQNDRGQIGVPLSVAYRTVAGRAAHPLVFEQVGTGVVHSCGRGADGRVHCWGSNFLEQLGNPAAPDILSDAVMSAGGGSFPVLAVGGYHGCVLDDGGGASCWGSGGWGQLGDGGQANRTLPVGVAGGLRFVSLSAGDRHTCGITNGGAAYCWGLGHTGQLGAGEPPDRCGVGADVPCAVAPVPVAGGLSFSSLSAGYSHTCGLDADGSAWCWGYGAFGQLGSGASGAGADAWTPVAVAGGQRYEQLAAGGGFTCGLDADGAASCWGYNDDGQLGAGDRQNRPVPGPLTGGLAFVELRAGSWHACGLTAAGEAYCWGRNSRGQLGDGTTVSRSAPVRAGRL